MTKFKQPLKLRGLIIKIGRGPRIKVSLLLGVSVTMDMDTYRLYHKGNHEKMWKQWKH